MKIINGFIILCLGITVCYFLGLVQFLLDFQVDQCEMTYMFEYPQFVKISTKLDETYPKYELTAYSEGRFTQNARNMDFKGVPVLFVPGNAGSHKQVRSLSSIALRKALNSRTSFHFDYFSVNLNNEYSALSGVVLNDQLEYVNGSIYRILELYKGKIKPESVVLIGHSMGAVIAQKITSLLPSDSKLIPIVISLAGPLKRVPLIMDYQMEKFYQSINNTIPMDTTFISIAGGFSDFLIAPGIANDNRIRITQTVTTNIPKSWVEANHVQILWCKQTVLAINRALFDSVDLKTKQITLDPVYRRKVFEHHLIQNSGIKIRQINNYEDSMNINSQGKWTEIVEKQHTISLMNGVKQPQWFLIPILDHHTLNVLAVNLEVTDWIFMCRAIENICTNAVHLSQKSEIAPSIRYKRRFANFNLDELIVQNPEANHILIRVLPTDEPVVINIDLHPTNKRKLSVKLPKFWAFKGTTILQKTVKNSLSYVLEFGELNHVWQSYNLFVDSKCSSSEHHAVAQVVSPWGNNNLQQYFTESKKDPLNLRLYSSRPQNNKNDVVVKLTLDPNCEYSVTLKMSYLGVLGQLARHYSNLLIVNVAVVVLMTFRTQLIDYDTESFPLFFTAMCQGLKPYYLLTSGKLLTTFLSLPIWLRNLPIPDTYLLKEENLDFFVLPLLVYMCSVGIVWLLVIGFSVAIVMMESSINRVTLKFISKLVRFPVTWTDYLISALHKLPFAVAALLTILTFSGCGALALTLGTVFYFLKLTQMSQDLIEDVLWYFVKNIAKDLKKRLFGKKIVIETEIPLAIEDVEEVQETIEEKSEDISEDKIDETDEKSENDELVAVTEVEETINEETTPEIQTQKPIFTAHNALFFHSSIFFIWVLITLLNLPIVLIWAHNFKYKTMMSPDPSFIPGLALSLCAFPLWQMDLPKQKKWNKEISQFIVAIATIALVFAPISLYRLNYLLTLVMIIITLQQLFAPDIEPETEENDKDKHLEEKYDRVKTKLE